MKVKVAYGMSNEVETGDFGSGATVRQILNSKKLQDFLGFDPAQVEAVIDGQPVRNLDTRVEDGDEITLQTKSGTKGA